jgi:hypothetical protein
MAAEERRRSPASRTAGPRRPADQADTGGGIDKKVLGAALDEARRAVRGLARIEAKAKVIAHGADEIQGMLTFQLRRINLTLDNAAAGLACQESRAVS